MYVYIVGTYYYYYTMPILRRFPSIEKIGTTTSAASINELIFRLYLEAHPNYYCSCHDYVETIW